MASPLVRAATIGFVSGLRTMIGPAAARIREGGPAAIVLGVLALGELVGDKLPKTPPRTQPLPLSGRALAGGFAAVRVTKDELDTPVAFAIGAAAAVGASFLAIRLRSEAVRRTGLPDPGDRVRRRRDCVRPGGVRNRVIHSVHRGVCKLSSS